MLVCVASIRMNVEWCLNNVETNAERLERLKANNKNLRKFLRDVVDKFPQILDMEWSVEQAERAQQLEGSFNVSSCLVKFKSITEIENKRLREAINQSLDKHKWNNEESAQILEKALGALE